MEKTDQKQQEYLSLLKDMVKKRTAEKNTPPTYFIFTMGCQMNARDSEKLSGILTKAGMTEGMDEKADLVIYNTCTVRENANEKLYGHLGAVKSMMEDNPDKIIAICGCMMQEADESRRIRDRYPFVNLVFGTHNLWKFPELLYTCIHEEKRIFETPETSDYSDDALPVKRKYVFKSGVNIMYGCDNFCSYCIVPYVRGRERSRRPEDILNEIRSLSGSGVKEVMLLGQNVNSYGRKLSDPVSFAELLEQVCAVDGIQRVRFMTSHPKDLSDDLIRVMQKELKICHHLHLPLQSGSDRILQKMNRHYTKEGYLSLTDKIKNAIPDMALSTDIIVGFPGETEEDFQETLDVVRKVGFQAAFTFIYSKRTGTPAAAMPDQVPPEVIANRFKRLLSLVQELSSRSAGNDLNRVLPVLVEGEDEHREGYLTGRLGNNLMVHFPGRPEEIGNIENIRLTESKGFYYNGIKE